MSRKIKWSLQQPRLEFREFTIPYSSRVTVLASKEENWKKKEKKGNASRRLIALKIPPVNRGEQEYI